MRSRHLKEFYPIRLQMSLVFFHAPDTLDWVIPWLAAGSDQGLPVRR
jgi:hypothetical protein